MKVVGLVGIRYKEEIFEFLEYLYRHIVNISDIASPIEIDMKLLAEIAFHLPLAFKTTVSKLIKKLRR